KRQEEKSINIQMLKWDSVRFLVLFLNSVISSFKDEINDSGGLVIAADSKPIFYRRQRLRFTRYAL
ncbi:MAG: hypothetical protein C0175_04245, partial [Caldisericum exile]